MAWFKVGLQLALYMASLRSQNTQKNEGGICKRPSYHPHPTGTARLLVGKRPHDNIVANIIIENFVFN